MADAANIDAQLSDMVTGSASCGAHALKRAREYAASAHFIGLLAGVVGSADERKEARETVMAALADIGFSADDAAMRRDSLEKAAAWKRLSDMRTAGMTPEQLADHRKSMDAAMAEWNEAAKPLAEKWSPQGVFNRLWSSLADIYSRAIKFVREDMWKKSLCELSVDAGFIILETGVAAALAAAGLAAAAAFLKVVAIASKGSRLVTITVKATRGLKGGAAARNPAHMLGSERKYSRTIDTGEVNADAKKFLDESGQGNATTPDRSPAKGDEAGAGSKKSWRAKEVAGRKVYQRDDLIDPNRVDERGRTNLQRMQNGLGPVGSDGREINLHHLTQDEPGPMAEITASKHSENDRVLHMYSNQHDKSWRDKDGTKRQYRSAPDTMDRGPFNQWKKSYWKIRAKDFQ
jgi:A nuclease of the HNH/ENDO VII superfamily with conserved LHH